MNSNVTFHSKGHYIKSFPSFEWNKQQSKGLMPVGMWCRGLLDPDSYPYMTRHLILCLRLINNYTHPIQNFQAKYPNTLVKKLNSLLLGLALSGFFLWIVQGWRGRGKGGWGKEGSEPSSSSTLFSCFLCLYILTPILVHLAPIPCG